eukprot:gnl/MRDRNA2_/MRDRNA2_24121_c0_seq2.p1 gnl/MRDRNA2_/MRDRNA2_24121_c0~~gnl/MRDRNA2_/MRDRNA2_24121_c0_seq2.p1  ORF type:complete len:260 (-),score=35.67 gnl/MRDRNA2_/MRDRNA2_24121_c0_seq2:187-966(-)
MQSSWRKQRMRSFCVVMLHAIIAASVHAENILHYADNLADKLVDKLVYRVLKSTVPMPGASTSMAHRPFSRSKFQLRAAPPYREWQEGNAQRTLSDRGLTEVTCERALKMMKDKDCILVDVRPENAVKYGKMMPNGQRVKFGRPKGAVNVPYFRELTGTSLRDNINRLVCGVGLRKPATERNPEFVQMALGSLPRNKTIVLACDRGGSLMKGDSAFYTRSLQAAYELYDAGFTRLRVLKGGIPEWQGFGFPMEDSGNDE